MAGIGGAFVVLMASLVVEHVATVRLIRRGHGAVDVFLHVYDVVAIPESQAVRGITVSTRTTKACSSVM